MTPKKPLAKTLWKYGQWVLLIVFLWFVCKRGLTLWQQSDASLEGVRWEIIWTGCPVILISWLTGAWFWRQLILSHGERPPVVPTFCAHYAGQIGKYMPGKGMVLIIRASMLKPYGVPFAVSLATAVYETLLSMGAGLLLGLCLVPIVLPDLAVDKLAEDSLIRWFLNLVGAHPILLSLGIVALTFACLPLISWLMNRVASKMVKLPEKEEIDPVLPDDIEPTEQDMREVPAEIRREKVTTRDLATGIIVAVVGWVIQSMALGIVLYSIGVENITWSDSLFWTMSCMLATTVGFMAVFAPGGIGVREAIIVECLRLDPSINDQQAVSAALLLRVLMFVSDILAGLVCSSVARWYKKRHLVTSRS